jgi:hypothetical protein
MRDLLEMRVYEFFRIATSYERCMRTWRKGFCLMLVAGILFLKKNHENPPVEAKK